MRKSECIEFLQWALPQMHHRWRGFRKVRGQVQKRLRRRLEELGLSSLEDYRRYLQAEPAEWERLEALCRISITRFFRDRDVWERLARLLPELSRGAGGGELRAWSAGCAGGEEPYTLVLVARLLADPPVGVRVVATDADERQLDRARRARYQPGTLKDLPEDLRRAAFEPAGGELSLRPDFRRPVELRCSDLRRERPAGRFQLVLCRYLAFTYFDQALQREIAGRLAEATAPGGLLVLGKHEAIPPGDAAFEELGSHRRIYRRR